MVIIFKMLQGAVVEKAFQSDTLLFRYFYNMATSQKLLTEKVFKGYMKQYVTRKELKDSAKNFVTKKVFKNHAKKMDRGLRDIDDNFKSVDRAFVSTNRRISDLAANFDALRQEMYQGFDSFREEMRQFRQDLDQKFSLLLSEIRQDRFETHQLRERVTVLEGKVT